MHSSNNSSSSSGHDPIQSMLLAQMRERLQQQHQLRTSPANSVASIAAVASHFQQHQPPKKRTRISLTPQQEQQQQTLAMTSLMRTSSGGGISGGGGDSTNHNNTSQQLAQLIQRQQMQEEKLRQQQHERNETEAAIMKLLLQQKQQNEDADRVRQQQQQQHATASSLMAQIQSFQQQQQLHRNTTITTDNTSGGGIPDLTSFKRAYSGGGGGIPGMTSLNRADSNMTTTSLNSFSVNSNMSEKVQQLLQSREQHPNQYQQSYQRMNEEHTVRLNDEQMPPPPKGLTNFSSLDSLAIMQMLVASPSSHNSNSSGSAVSAGRGRGNTTAATTHNNALGSLTSHLPPDVATSAIPPPPALTSSTSLGATFGGMSKQQLLEAAMSPPPLGPTSAATARGMTEVGAAASLGINGGRNGLDGAAYPTNANGVGAGLGRFDAAEFLSHLQFQQQSGRGRYASLGNNHHHSDGYGLTGRTGPTTATTNLGSGNISSGVSSMMERAALLNGFPTAAGRLSGLGGNNNINRHNPFTNNREYAVASAKLAEAEAASAQRNAARIHNIRNAIVASSGSNAPRRSCASIDNAIMERMKAYDRSRDDSTSVKPSGAEICTKKSIKAAKVYNQNRLALASEVSNKVRDSTIGKPADTFHNREPNGRARSLPTLLVVPMDHTQLSSHQTLLRYQIEVFQAGEEDTSTHTRGRNKPVKRGQIGIRCRHCKVLPVTQRKRGSVYFPRAVEGFYQAAQNMNSTHLQTGECPMMGEALKEEFATLIATRGISTGAGRSYWANHATLLGLRNTDDGIVFDPITTTPTPSSAAASSLAISQQLLAFSASASESAASSMKQPPVSSPADKKDRNS